MELFNYGNDSDNESDAEIEEDLMKMFAAPEEKLEMDSTSGGLKFANSDEEEEADFLAELDKDLLFLDDGEAAVERARALEKHEKEKQAEEERAEQELKAQIESMKDGIQRMAIEDNTKRSRKERYKARRNRKNLGVRRSKGTDLDDFMDGKAELHTASVNSDGEKRFLSLAEERKERMESLNTKSRQEHRQSVYRGSDSAVSMDDLSHNVRDDDAGQTFMNRKSKRGSRKDVNDAGSMATGASTGAPDNLESKRQMRKAKRKSRKEARSKMAQKMEQSLQQADVRNLDSENGAEDRATAANSASANGAATKAPPAPGEAPDNLASKRQMRKAKRKSRKEARSKMAQKMEQSLQQADVRDSEKTAGSKEDGSLATQAAVTAPTAKPHFCAMC